MLRRSGRTCAQLYRLLPAMKKLPVSDLQDWEAIADWAEDLAAKFTKTG
jgi:hypothetical protein